MNNLIILQGGCYLIPPSQFDKEGQLILKDMKFIFQHALEGNTLQRIPRTQNANEGIQNLQNRTSSHCLKALKCAQLEQRSRKTLMH
ncbi:hypothetical protein FGO68_gene17179 [Halteria grandinella]|uniref:Uncharacterized protein n=1 Tax=Halteria grandinella TaxID=5974 RepID=A0A8J8NQF9_HALGN|nr:hypothetical protein FGO68_gene17179 [Halteria grandinella]